MLKILVKQADLHKKREDEGKIILVTVGHVCITLWICFLPFPMTSEHIQAIIKAYTQVYLYIFDIYLHWFIMCDNKIAVFCLSVKNENIALKAILSFDFW